ncbi:DNA-protecting protein DprA [Candidatus Uhrbacteria bacterium]|nr:DNA-protecting protein DprA [Candidatus Uhrbacteria bacterium]
MPNGNPDKNKILWASLTQIEQIGAVRLARLRRAFGDPEEVFRASRHELTAAGLEEKAANIFLEKRKNINISEFEEKLNAEKINILLPEDPGYPALLREIPDLPQILFLRGSLSSLRFPLAVVGTRKMTPYGKRAAEEITAPLAAAKISIFSGLALGIDTVAHRAALRAAGHTVAVLGSGCDSASIYPASNQNLAKEIIDKGGAIISEYPPGSLSFKSHFPVRNRIIAGATLGTLVVEADLDSGSLITARAALDYNREVFAVPGNIMAETSRGSNNLLKMGARLVTGSEDIASILGVNMEIHVSPPLIPAGPEEAALMLSLRHDSRHIDELSRESGLDISTVSATLTLLEMRGAVRHMGGMHYALSR